MSRDNALLELQRLLIMPARILKLTLLRRLLHFLEVTEPPRAVESRVLWPIDNGAAHAIG
jgi:hypothetical protein